MNKFGDWDYLFLEDEEKMFVLGGEKHNVHSIQDEWLRPFYLELFSLSGYMVGEKTFETTISILSDLQDGLESSPESKDPRIMIWRKAMRCLVDAAHAFDPKIHRSLEGSDRQEYQHSVMRSLAEAADPTMIGYVDRQDSLFPLSPCRDPDTNWDTFIRHISPKTRWSFFSSTFRSQCQVGEKSLGGSSWLTNPELYENNESVQWSPLFGISLYARLAPLLSQGSPLLESVRRGPGDETTDQMIFKLFSHEDQKVRARACFGITSGHRMRQCLEDGWRYQSRLVDALISRIRVETDVEVQRCILSSLLTIWSLENQITCSQLTVCRRIYKFAMRTRQELRERFPDHFQSLLKNPDEWLRSGILVVEEDEAKRARRTHESDLTAAAGYVHMSPNLVHARKRLNADPPKLVILNRLRYNGLDSAKFLSNMRRHDILRTMPVLLLLGDVPPKEITDLLLKPEHFLPSQAPLDSLRALIRKILKEEFIRFHGAGVDAKFMKKCLGY